MEKFASVSGVSEEEFSKCLDNKEIETQILETRKIGQEKHGVDGTPYIIINGHPHKGNRSYNAVKKEIETILKTVESQ